MSTLLPSYQQDEYLLKKIIYFNISPGKSEQVWTDKDNKQQTMQISCNNKIVYNRWGVKKKKKKKKKKAHQEN